jgi:hypothetical protein
VGNRRTGHLRSKKRSLCSSRNVPCHRRIGRAWRRTDSWREIKLAKLSTSRKKSCLRQLGSDPAAASGTTEVVPFPNRASV